MATAGEGSSAPTSSGYEGGGVGGKFSKRQFRKTRTTPYDRPPTALRNPSWLSKLVVDPATKLISASAKRFFASFRKRLPPASTPPPNPRSPKESNQEFSGELQEAVPKNNAEAPEAICVDSHNLTVGGNSGISDLEQLLKQKTFSKSEVDHLTELLHSRAAGSPVECNFKKAEANLSIPAMNLENQQLLKSELVETRTETGRSRGVISTLGVSAGVPEDVASPAELAKAYMGSRMSKVSPSMLGLQSQAIRQDAALLSNIPFTPKSRVMSLATETAVQVSENGFTTPRTRGRSTIYNMARSPYSRFNPTNFGKGSASRSHDYDGSLLPSSALQEPDGEPVQKLALKRRSSALDDDLGSVGPMRRIRQKHNLLPHKLSSPNGIAGGASDTAQQPSSLAKKLPSKDNWRQKGLKVVGETADNGTPSKTYAGVPTKSVEVAAKIFQSLERMTPKEKSAESKLVAAMENSPTKLTTDMLHGWARRSLEDAGTSKLLQNVQGSQMLEDWTLSGLTNLHGSTFQKEGRIEENGPKKIDVQHDMLTPSATSDPAASVKDVTPGAEASDSASKSIAQHPQKKKQAFTMSAQEDFLELDEDTHCNGLASQSLVEGSGKLETSVTDKNSCSAEKQVQNQIPSFPEIEMTPPESIFSRTNAEIENNSLVDRERAGVAFPALHMLNSTSQSVTNTPAASAFEKPKQAIDRIPAFDNSLPSDAEFSGSKPSFWMLQKPQSSISSGEVTDLPLEVPVSGKQDDNDSQEASERKGKTEILPSFAFGSSSSSSISSSILPGNSVLRNGPLGISPSTLLSSPAPSSTGFANQLITDSVSTVAPAAAASPPASTWNSATSSSSPLVSTSLPSYSAGPSFGSQSSHDATTAASSGSTAPDAEASVMKMKMEKEAKTSCSSIPLFGCTSFGVASTGSSLFGLDSNPASTAKCQSQGTGGESVFSVQPSVAGSGSATVSLSMPFQFGSSASSSAFGTSGVSSFASSYPLFNSATPAAKLFSSGASFGLSSSMSLSEAKPVGSASASAPTSEANAACTSSGATPNAFSFGASSSASSSMTNNVSSSGSATPAIFSFGVSSSSGNNLVSSSACVSSCVFGISTMSSSSATDSASSSSAPSTVFGSSWQTPKLSSPFVATFNSSPSAGFSFTAASSSVAATSTPSMVFGSSSGVASGPVFSFTAVSSAPSSSPSPFSMQPMFANSAPTFTSTGNNDHMSTEDSMAEDPVQSSTPVVPAFGQQPVSPSPPGFVFGSAVLQSSSPFQFGGQQNQGALQNSSPFQSTSSVELNAGGSFSLGSGGLGGDKSGRKIVKVNRSRHRKK